MKKLHSYRLSESTEKLLEKLKEYNRICNETEIIERSIEIMYEIQRISNEQKNERQKENWYMWNKEDVEDLKYFIENGYNEFG